MLNTPSDLVVDGKKVTPCWSTPMDRHAVARYLTPNGVRLLWDHVQSAHRAIYKTNDDHMLLVLRCEGQLGKPDRASTVTFRDDTGDKPYVYSKQEQRQLGVVPMFKAERQAIRDALNELLDQLIHGETVAHG